MSTEKQCLSASGQKWSLLPHLWEWAALDVQRKCKKLTFMEKYLCKEKKFKKFLKNSFQQ